MRLTGPCKVEVQVEGTYLNKWLITEDLNPLLSRNTAGKMHFSSWVIVPLEIECAVFILWVCLSFPHRRWKNNPCSQYKLVGLGWMQVYFMSRYLVQCARTCWPNEGPEGWVSLCFCCLLNASHLMHSHKLPSTPPERSWSENPLVS